MVRSVPNPRTWLPLDFVTDTLLNTEIRDALKYLLDPPRAELRQTATQTLTTSTWADITFTTEDYDQADDPGHDTVTNTARYTAPAAGWYEVSGIVAFAANATGNRAVRIAVNGTAVNNSQVMQPNTGAGNSPAVPYPVVRVFLNAGDFVTLQGWQSSGGNLATVATTDLGSRFNVRFIGK